MKAINLDALDYQSQKIAQYEGDTYQIQKFRNDNDRIKNILTLLYEEDVAYGYAFECHYLLTPYVEGIILSELYEQVDFMEGIKLAIDLLFQLLPYENNYEMLYLLSDSDHISYDLSFHLLQGVSLYRMNPNIKHTQAINAVFNLVLPFIEKDFDKILQKNKAIQNVQNNVTLMTYQSVAEILDDYKVIQKEYLEQLEKKQHCMSWQTKIKMVALISLSLMCLLMVMIHFIYHNLEELQSLFPLSLRICEINI